MEAAAMANRKEYLALVFFIVSPSNFIACCLTMIPHISVSPDA